MAALVTAPVVLSRGDTVDAPPGPAEIVSGTQCEQTPKVDALISVSSVNTAQQEATCCPVKLPSCAAGGDAKPETNWITMA